MDVEVKNPRALKPKYNGVPLRYEESKPVLTQAFTHKNILGLGQKVHSQWEKSSEIEKDRAISAAKQDVWEQAEHAKKVALDKSKQSSTKELERTIENLKISQERSIKEEALRVEGEMKKEALEQVKVEKERGESILAQTVEKVKAVKEQEKVAAVGQARKEEIEKAAKAAEGVAKETSQREAAAAKKAALEQKEALQSLESKKNEERVQAVLAAQRQERKIAADELAKVKKAHSLEIAALHEKIKEWEQTDKKTWKEVEREKAEKEAQIEEFKRLKTSYQRFVDRTRGFTAGQADFLIE